MARFELRPITWVAVCLAGLAGSTLTCRSASAQLFGPPPLSSAPTGNGNSGHAATGPPGGGSPSAPSQSGGSAAGGTAAPGSNAVAYGPPPAPQYSGPPYSAPPYSAPPYSGPPLAPYYGPPSAPPYGAVRGNPPPAGLAALGPRPTAHVLEGAQVMAWVDNQAILAGEIFSQVDQLMQENKDKIPASSWDEQRLKLSQQALKSRIKSKLVFVDALKKIPDKNLPEFEKHVNEQFETEQVKRMMKNTHSTSRAELETKLLAQGSSIDQERRSFYEHSITAQWLHTAIEVDKDKEISNAEMLSQYQAHLKDYEHPAKARWEQLSVDFSRFRTKSDAYAALSRMGNDVLRGVPFSQVAKAGSQGVNASDGGQWGWTSQGSLVSRVLDEALFHLPVGTLSPILEDSQAFHIVRVLERVGANRTPYTEAQDKIREAIKKQRETAASEKYFEKLRKEIRVWTVFDDTVTLERFARSLPSHRPR